MMTKRDLLRDLEIAKKATPGPWYDYGRYGDENPCGHEVTIKGDIHHVIAEEVSANNARFITEAREGWPEAIQRALKAEAGVERLRALLDEQVVLLESAAEVLQDEHFETSKAYLKVAFNLRQILSEEAKNDALS